MLGRLSCRRATLARAICRSYGSKRRAPISAAPTTSGSESKNDGSQRDSVLQRLELAVQRLPASSPTDKDRARISSRFRQCLQHAASSSANADLEASVRRMMAFILAGPQSRVVLACLDADTVLDLIRQMDAVWARSEQMDRFARAAVGLWYAWRMEQERRQDPAIPTTFSKWNSAVLNLIHALKRWQRFGYSPTIPEPWISAEIIRIYRRLLELGDSVPEMSDRMRCLFATTYSGLGQPEEALAVLQPIKLRILPTCAIDVLRTLADKGWEDLAYLAYEDWSRSGKIHFSAVQNSLFLVPLLRKGKLPFVRRILDHLLQNELSVPISVVSSYLNACIDFPISEKDLKLLRRFVSRAIQAHHRDCSHRNSSENDQESQELIRNMYSTSMKVIVKAGDVNNGERKRQCLLLVRDMVDHGVELDEPYWSMIMDTYQKAGNSHVCMTLWNELVRETPWALSMSEMLQAYDPVDRKEDAEDRFVLNVLADSMRASLKNRAAGEHVHPSFISIVIDNLGFNGPHQLLLPLWRRVHMRNELFGPLNMNHYNSMIEALARNHQVQDAWDVLVEAQVVGHTTGSWKSIELKTVRSFLSFAWNQDRHLFRRFNAAIAERWPHLSAQLSADGTGRVLM